jgi:hypothetical protein
MEIENGSKIAAGESNTVEMPIVSAVPRADQNTPLPASKGEEHVLSQLSIEEQQQLLTTMLQILQETQPNLELDSESDQLQILQLLLQLQHPAGQPPPPLIVPLPVPIGDPYIETFAESLYYIEEILKLIR